MDNIKVILENVCTLMASPTREVVASCLSFIKTYCVTLPSPMVAESLEPIVRESKKIMLVLNYYVCTF